ncbi:AAA family ATPase [Vibrio coralliilyticus]|uniref:AAA family ATPase n=1 Tax=Vibrio coralliilyticus TaxID=190893 RepID=UPI000BAA9E20|nr:AAA family ATPase [Vibrio coralliilyticus]NOI60807.1 AAA family ATPase [Vibrio coralliilyticus]PAT69667.1 kinase [Vibrio coralliilyticus]
MNRPILYIFSGLPASGKSTLAQHLAQHTSSMYVRIDTVEQGLRDLCSFKVEGEGYRLSYRIIEDNLRLGISAIADSCNPIELTRREWCDVATSVDARFVDIEIWCSDKEEHKHRVQTRPNTVKNLVLPNWEQVENRHYEAWPDDIIRIDTAGKSIEQAFTELLDKLEVWSSPA